MNFRAGRNIWDLFVYYPHLTHDYTQSWKVKVSASNSSTYFNRTYILPCSPVLFPINCFITTFISTVITFSKSRQCLLNASNMLDTVGLVPWIRLWSDVYYYSPNYILMFRLGNRGTALLSNLSEIIWIVNGRVFLQLLKLLPHGV